jgi:NosR/NirI family transcriptional regulator, nitrous oxide reductase regulator
LAFAPYILFAIVRHRKNKTRAISKPAILPWPDILPGHQYRIIDFRKILAGPVSCLLTRPAWVEIKKFSYQGNQMKYLSLRPVRFVIMALAPLLLIALSAAPVLACDITISPSSATGAVGDTVTFTINVQETHRNCSVPIQETQIKLKGMEMVSQTAWKELNSTLNQKQITVRLTAPGEGSLEVIRVCSKGGDDQIARVTITASKTSTPAAPAAPAPAATGPGQATPPATTSTTSAQPEPASSQFVSDAADLTWWEAFIDGITQPHILALLILVIAGTIFLALKLRRIRYMVLLTSLAYLGFVIGGCPCVLGSLQSVILRASEIKYYMTTYLQVLIPLIGTVIFGRVFCGWVCPMGATQHFVFRKEAGKKMKSFEPGPRLHNILRYAKYLFLVVLVASVLITGTTAFASIDPFKSLFNLDFSFWVPTALLILLLAASLFIGFPWCKYACPLGAFFGLFAKFTVFKVKIGDKCTNCKACHTTFCDYRAIKPGETRPAVNQVECMRCGECIARCPCKAIEFTRG